MLRYYKYPDEYSDIAPATYYQEVDEDGWVLRQLTFNGEKYLSSNIDMDLPDKDADYESLVAEGEVTPITKQEFDTVWGTYLALRQTKWDSAKQAYTIGMPVQGSLKLFYPQGVIVDLANDILGIADHKACRASTTSENMYPHHKVTAVVSGYDEENQWIKLESPQVHQEVIPL